ncbi:MAG: Ig-like domain-containing protein, partial [Terracidiphilus sp.]
MRGIICRGLRLELVAGLGIALAMPALAMAAVNAQRLATQTAVTVETRDKDGRTQATVAVTVTGEDGLPATGAIAISDYGSQLAGAALNAQGQANIVLDLPAGDHSLTAVYAGDATHLGSTSQESGAQAQASSTPNFLVSVAPATLSLT